MAQEDKGKKQAKDTKEGIEQILGGTLNILGLKIDLGDLLSSSEDLERQLNEVRERLKGAGGKEVLSDQEWAQKGMSVGGYVRTRGLLGDKEFHIGTTGPPEHKVKGRPAPSAAEVVEPPVDVFTEEQQVVIVADVPGVGLEDLELRVEDSVFSLAAKPLARRNYRKQVTLTAEVDPASLSATCRNGVLEVRIARRKEGR
ncbi:MAG: Hsp20/alpha crystallin family protein [Chloroflexota bacterium]